MQCSSCPAPYHPATGHLFSEQTQICGTCAGRFWAWVVAHTGKRASRRGRAYTRSRELERWHGEGGALGRDWPERETAFYDAAASSVHVA